MFLEATLSVIHIWRIQSVKKLWEGLDEYMSKSAAFNIFYPLIIKDFYGIWSVQADEILLKNI